MLVFPGPTHVTVASCKLKRVTLSCLGPQVGMDRTVGMAGTLHMAFHCGLSHNMVLSEYQKAKNRSCKTSCGLDLEGAKHCFCHSTGQSNKKASSDSKGGRNKLYLLMRGFMKSVVIFNLLSLPSGHNYLNSSHI